MKHSLTTLLITISLHSTAQVKQKDPGTIQGTPSHFSGDNASKYPAAFGSQSGSTRPYSADTLYTHHQADSIAFTREQQDIQAFNTYMRTTWQVQYYESLKPTEVMQQMVLWINRGRK